MKETQVRSLDQENPPEEGMATHSSILVRKISWTQEPGGLQLLLPEEQQQWSLIALQIFFTNLSTAKSL